jgi:lipopolysaccharide export system permease protein
MKADKFKRGNISRTMVLYIFTETMFAFFVAFLFFFFVFFCNQLLLLANDVLSKKVPFAQVALLVFYSFPTIIAMSTPFATLLGPLMTVGRLSSDNEVLVMLTSGLSYKNVFTPTILVGIIVTIFSFGVNDVLLPMGTIAFQRLWRDILISTPALEIEPNSVKHFNNTALITGAVTGKAIDNMLILDRTSDGERRLIMADNAAFVDDSKSISLELTNAFLHSSKETERRDYDYATMSFLRYRLPVNDVIDAVTTIGPNQMSSIDVYQEIKEKERALGIQVNESSYKLLENAYTIESTLRQGAQDPQWNQRVSQIAAFTREKTSLESLKMDRSLAIYKLEFNKKFSVPAGAFSLIMLAIPLGLLAKKSGQTMGFLFGIILSVLYWALLLIGQNMGIRLGASPFWTMWTPNLISIAIGIVMAMVRVRK